MTLSRPTLTPSHQPDPVAVLQHREPNDQVSCLAVIGPSSVHQKRTIRAKSGSIDGYRLWHGFTGP